MATVITRVINPFFEENRHIIKVLRYGDSDIQEAEQVAPYGIDSAPIKDMVAIYSDTGVSGEPVIVGYINENQLAKPGETRLYATDDKGNLKNYLWLKGDGSIELGGNKDNAVRYAELDAAIKKYTDLIGTELTKISAALTGVGGAYAPQNPSLDIAKAKIEEVKTS